MTQDIAKTLDQFYTNPKIAQRFVETVDDTYGFDNFDYIIEPSMGEGFIYDLLPKDKRIGLDIEKNHKECFEIDFLKWSPQKSGIDFDHFILDLPKILFIGNPPFGRSSSLAIKFFRHASKFSDVICFIIPRTWMFSKIQNKIPEDFKLMYNAILPDESFIYKQNPYVVKCCMQMWSRYDPLPDYHVENDVDWRDMCVFDDQRQVEIDTFKQETEAFFQSGKRDK